MACFRPLTAYKFKSGDIVFDFHIHEEHLVEEMLKLPCGKCIGCRLARSREWAIRCVHEASLHEHNCFITLTYDDDHLPMNNSLDLRDFQLFMKRLRFKFGNGIRYYHCGEYGDNYRRPHYHACLFNFDFADKKIWKCDKKNKLYRSHDLEQVKKDNIRDLELAKANYSRQLQEVSAKGNAEIQRLTKEIDTNKIIQSQKITNATNELEKKCNQLENNIKQTAIEKELTEASLKENYKIQINDRDLEIKRLTEMKARLSVKMIGESLEQHCETEFNKIRPIAFRNAYFEKDNDVSNGSKGDYIFRDFDLDLPNTEITSIMFEMKNKSDQTATKKKNKDFFKKLDEDRSKKRCEYAVLVSLLEPDNETYNEGIVDVFHHYKKMYVIRPQFFIPIISILRTEALNSLEYKKEITSIKSKNIDITNFEDNWNEFKNKFSNNYELASENFKNAIDEIDKSIKNLEVTKKALRNTNNQLRLANKKAHEITIKNLTSKNPIDF